jgi:hypothetical protein
VILDVIVNPAHAVVERLPVLVPTVRENALDRSLDIPAAVVRDELAQGAFFGRDL